MRKFKWRRRIGEPVFPRWELLDGFPAREPHWCEDTDDAAISRRRARWIVTLLAGGRPYASRWVGNVTTTSAWAVWYKLTASAELAVVYDRKTRTSSRSRVEFSHGTMKACVSVGSDDNGAACVLHHYSMEGYR